MNGLACSLQSEVAARLVRICTPPTHTYLCGVINR